MFGAGMLVLGSMLGVLGIAWCKRQERLERATQPKWDWFERQGQFQQCLPDEKAELADRERELERQEKLRREERGERGDFLLIVGEREGEAVGEEERPGQ